MGAPVLSRVATILSPPFKTIFPDTGPKSSTQLLNLLKSDLLCPMDPALSGGTRRFLLAKGSIWGRDNVTPGSSEGLFRGSCHPSALSITPSHPRKRCGVLSLLGCSSVFLNKLAPTPPHLPGDSATPRGRVQLGSCFL